MNISSFTRRAALFGIVPLVLLSGACATPGSATEPLAPRASRISPANQDPIELTHIADKAYFSGRLLEAQRHYRALTEAVPNDNYAWFRLGNIRLRQGDVNGAERAYGNSLAIEKDNAKAWYNLATARLMTAKSALRGAWERLRPEDPAREITLTRLDALDQLISPQPVKVEPEPKPRPKKRRKSRKRRRR